MPRDVAHADGDGDEIDRLPGATHRRGLIAAGEHTGVVRVDATPCRGYHVYVHTYRAALWKIIGGLQMVCKRVETVRVDGRMTIIAETKDQVLFANGRYVGRRCGQTLTVAPTADEDVREAVAIYAARHGWAVG